MLTKSATQGGQEDRDREENKKDKGQEEDKLIDA